MFSGSKLLLLWLTMFPAVEKTLSAGTDVAGIQRYFLAKQADFRDHSVFSPYQSIVFTSEPTIGSLKKCSNSSSYTLLSCWFPRRKERAVSFFHLFGGGPPSVQVWSSVLGSTAHAQTHASAQDSNLGIRIPDSSQNILTKRIFVAALYNTLLAMKWKDSFVNKINSTIKKIQVIFLH